MSNPYPPSFEALLADQPADALVLDVGSGGRRHPRVIGLAYMGHPNNSVQGDALALPFRDDSFDLVQCQAVLEHVTDPQQAVNEMTRVLRPGAVMYLEVAFMQPVHQPPRHYFNHTPFALAHLCRHLDVLATGAFGTITEQLAWFLRAAGADTILSPQQWRTFERIARTQTGGRSGHRRVVESPAMSGTPLGIADTDVGVLLAPMDPWIWPSLVENGTWEPDVGEVVRSILGPGDTAINVGAHVGYYTLMMSAAVGPWGMVFAYEPAPSNRRLLELNTASCHNVVIRDRAVDDGTRPGVLVLSSINPGDHRLDDRLDDDDVAATLPVNVVRLDDEAFISTGPLRLIFCDAQGADLRILRGGRALIAKHRPHVIIEWTPYMLNPDDYAEVDALLDMGYTASIIEGPHIVIGRAIDGNVIGNGTGTMHLTPPAAE